MKDNLYYIEKLGCFAYVLDETERTISFATAHFLLDTFTTISQYTGNKDVFELFNPILVTDNNIPFISENGKYNKEAIRAMGKGNSYEFGTKYGFELTKTHVQLLQIYHERFAKYESKKSAK